MALLKSESLLAHIDILSGLVTGVAGAGTISTGTFGAPKTYRWKQDGIIVTQIVFDITGWTAQGANADDVIGLATGAAHIGKYVVADCGVVFKTTFACLETPTQDAASVTFNLDITANSGVLEEDGAAGGVQVHVGDTMVIGEMREQLLNVMVANDYIYVTDADIAGDTGSYAGGQFIFTMYGHANLD